MITVYNNTNEHRMGERLARVPDECIFSARDAVLFPLIFTALPAGWYSNCTHFTGEDIEVLRGHSRLSKTVTAGRWQS